MKPVPLEQAFSADFLEIYNALAIEKPIPYRVARYADDVLVFSNDGHHLEAHASDGRLLCKGEQDKDGFTGYKETGKYIGEFAKSKWCGFGRERIDFFIHHLPAGRDRRVGTWREGTFVKETIHSVLLCKTGYDKLELFDGDICGLMTADHIDHSFYCLEDLSPFCLADVDYSDGNYEIIASSVIPLEAALNLEG